MCIRISKTAYAGSIPFVIHPRTLFMKLHSDLLGNFVWFSWKKIYFNIFIVYDIRLGQMYTIINIYIYMYFIRFSKFLYWRLTIFKFRWKINFSFCFAMKYTDNWKINNIFSNSVVWIVWFIWWIKYKNMTD